MLDDSPFCSANVLTGMPATSIASSASAYSGFSVAATVTMAAADHVMLKDKDGKDVTVKVTKDTKVKAQPAVKVQDIKVGSRIVITAVEGKDKSMTAKSIEVGAVAAPTK